MAVTSAAGGGRALEATRKRWTPTCASIRPDADGLEDDNVIHHWSATGATWVSQLHHQRTWCGSRHREVQLWTNRPIPELARYRTPIDGLYHAHQTSGHPGGLCLMAIPYNLMHVLIEDGIAEPGDWWYRHRTTFRSGQDPARE
jgi:phytoene dehydrogenase-like protein